MVWSSVNQQLSAIPQTDPGPKESNRKTQKTALMADGFNEIRAMRVAEIMTQYRNFQQQIAASRLNVPASQAQERGYVMLRQLLQAAQALAAQPLNLSIATGKVKNDEETKRELKKLIIDAAARRFRAYKIASRVTAILRWVNRRVQILKGQSPAKQHLPALQQAETILNQELAAVTDQRLYNELKARDVAAEHWVAEMPSLATLMAYIAAN